MGRHTEMFELVGGKRRGGELGGYGDYPGEESPASRRYSPLLCLLAICVIIVIVAVAVGVHYGVARQRKLDEDAVKDAEEAARDAAVPPADRLNCIPEGEVTESECEAKGCVWSPGNASSPRCHLAAGSGYTVQSAEETEEGFRVFLQLPARRREKRSAARGFYSTAVELLVFEARDIDNNIVRFKTFIKDKHIDKHISRVGKRDTNPEPITA
ncbi:PREDICTED: sucrase-isomaltase, intestinal-like [Priapulus caudatus]|uniref:Sucrase-isomaltase, intestinal-like n=1 Tax=Priapulus caudatus TaxID=37621 RepID=A0ABM1EYR0_PRICU|nr:PREDICTED: sucrase-isomaltase, intestinal-like [Priapulus caudatus]